MRNKFKNIISKLLISISLVYKSSPLFTMLAVVLEAITVILGYLLLFVSRQIINVISNNLDPSRELSQIISELIPYFIVTIVFTILIIFMNFIKNWVNELQQLKFGLFIDKNILEKSTSLDIAFFDDPSFYDNISIINSNKSRMYSLIYRVVFFASNLLSLLIAFIIAISAVNPIYPMLIIVLCIPALLTKGNYYINLYNYEIKNKVLQRKMSYLAGISADKSTAKEIRFYDMANFLLSKYYDLNRQYLEGYKKLVYRKGLLDSIFNILPIIGVMMCQYFVILNIVFGRSTVGDFIFLLGVFNNVQSSFIGLVDDMSKLQESEQVLDTYNNFMNTNISINDDGTDVLYNIKNIEFVNVDFTYPNSNTKVFNDVSFIMSLNEKNCVVGINGSGKSTFIKLLLRFYDVSKGEIYVNGKSIKSYTIKSIRRCFSVAFQEYMTYSLSIRDNVAFSSYANKNDDKRIINALKLVKLYDKFIIDNEIDIDSYISKDFDENGYELSGGEKQKLAIARCIFKNSDVIVMDEPDSSLDSKSEIDILNNIFELQKDRGLILISHRLSCTYLMDSIYVFKDGKLVEQGKHNDLLAKRGNYYELFSKHAEKYCIEI